MFPPSVLPEMAGHLGENLGAEAALPGLSLGTVERHPFHLSHIKLKDERRYSHTDKRHQHQHTVELYDGLGKAR